MTSKYINIIIAVLLTSLSINSCILYVKNQNLEEKLSISISNEKAFIAENSSLKNKSKATFDNLVREGVLPR